MNLRNVVALAGALFVTGAVAFQTCAYAQAPRRHPPVQTFQQGGVGCYWYRGRYFCARYCYLEVDGKRYCVERERQAHSQAAERDDDDELRQSRRPSSTMK